jgi:predicted nucleotidyltransferase component of viral defense system
MKEPVKNIPASIQARLKTEAEQQGRPFAEILQYYAMERFLFRLSKSRYATKFILKGGLLFYAWNIPLRRPTRDIDLRGYVTNDSEILEGILREVCAVSVSGDGIEFDGDSISIEETQIDADYLGVRAKLTAYLGRSRSRIQIDIGFSDALSSKAEPVEYPNLLPQLQEIHLKSYPKEAVVAEKFHAMIRHAELNSRMKDYYDIWLIAETFEFNEQSIQKAIETTFKQRETALPVKRPVSLSIGFAVANNGRWRNFLGKMDIGTTKHNDFSSVVEDVWRFVEYPLQCLANRTKSTQNWIPKKGWK